MTHAGKGRAPALLAALALGLLVASVAGCGGSSKARETTTAARPALAKGWTRVINRRAGFSLGMPSNWKANATAEGATLLRAPDRTVSGSIAVDRTEETTLMSLAQYVRASVRAIPGFRGLRVGRPVKVTDLRYAAVSASARGRFAKTGVHQTIDAFALRRETTATFSLLFFRSVRAAGDQSRVLAQILRSFRVERPVLK